jgi:hypothetical protein
MNATADGEDRSMTDDGQRQAIADELRRLEEDATYASQSQFEASKFWRLWHWTLGIPAAVLAAVAGFTGLASVTGRIPAAILALIAAVMGGLLTVVEPNKRGRQAQAAGVAYNEVRVGARQARSVYLPSAQIEEGRRRLSGLTEQKNQVDRVAEPTNTYAFWRAKRNVEAGRLRHVVDVPPGGNHNGNA